MGRRIQAAAAVCTLLLAISPAGPASGAEPADSAVAAVATFRAALQKELKEGLGDGPENAIRVCRDRAPRIAEESAPQGIRLGRSSSRVRNPQNAPAPWLEALLAQYEADPSDRSPKRVALPDGGTGYVEPIAIQPLCLVCHGEVLAPRVRETVERLYPKDAATGYRDGDFRGVFWAVTAPSAAE